MAKKWIWGITMMALLLTISLPVFAQESAVKGNISGVISDSTGAVLPGAKVILSGPEGSKTATSENDGRFIFPVLTLGTYSVRVEKQGFRAAELKGVEVVAGRTSSITITMQPGSTSEVVEVSGTAVTVDTSSSAVGADLADTFYQQVPVARNVASLFYVAPGAADSGGAGRSNPSISGGSGLENLYVADGVNITDAAFGGLGVFTRSQGSIGSGINLSFIKEVNVKTSGFEPQYGQATGGVVQLVTKSGGTAYHGEVGAYFAPQQAEATYLQSDNVRTNKAGLFLHRGNFDADGELGGYVPGFKNHLFFFGSFNPAWNQQFVAAPPTVGLAALGTMKLQADVYNYAGKLTLKLNDNHQVEGSAFGDPTHTTTGEQNYVLNTPNDTAMSKWNYGTRNVVVRYNGTLSPTWLVNASYSNNNNNFTETPKYNVVAITNRLNASNIYPLQGFGYLEGHDANTWAITADTQKIVHGLGEHTLSFGYHYEHPDYNDNKIATPGRFTVPITNAAGQPYLGGPDPNTGLPTDCAAGFTCPSGSTAYVWSGGLRKAPASCTLCPTYNGTPVYVRFGRGEFDPSAIQTFGRYHAAYANDAWQISKHITLSAGLRWEQWRMSGTFSGYTFTDNWAPRIGVTIDPLGDRKSKIYANFGRYNYQTPLDAAIRSLSAEKDIINMAFAPASTNGVVNVSPNGQITIPFDAAHTLNLANIQQDPNTGAYSCTNPAACGIAIPLSIGASQTGFAPGTKMMYADEYVVGADHEFKNGLVLSGRFIYRDLPRVLDDVAGISPEAYANNPNMTQNYFISNPGPNLDLFPNENESSFSGTAPTGCSFAVAQITDANGGTINPATGSPWNNGNGICWTKSAAGNWGGEVTTLPNGQTVPLPDGKPDGFPTPVHHYKAVEIEANKSFSNNWMLRANWRIASLTGNYEGAYRNDNGQTDPNISSLFDFTNGIIGMLGQQYAVGPLNTDRRHIVNVYTSYVFSKSFLKALELGTGVTLASGTPISELADHPAYGNAGEVPIGGRGKLGRTPVTGQVNLHVNRPIKVTEKSTLNLTADLFNLADSRPITQIDQTSQISFSPAANPDFLKVRAWQYQRPFYARFSVRWVF